jgi:ketosteroid isomerase-like protein
MMTRVDRVVTTELVADAYSFIEDIQVGRRHDYDDGYPECFDEAFELSLPPGYPEGEQVFRGRKGLKRWIDGIREIWDEWRMEQERFIVAGEQVVVLVHICARGHRSGVSLDRETAHIWSIAGDRVTKCEVYFDRAEALEAVDSPDAAG